jgi:hypothetical protein
LAYKKNNKVFQAVVQVDRLTYDRLIKAGDLFIGYDHCYVFDAVEILRCYNCNEFKHSSKNCNQKRSCPRCAVVDGLDHAVAECKASGFKCINCLKRVQRDKIDLDVNHAAWDVDCPTYKVAVEKFKDDVLFKQ